MTIMVGLTFPLLKEMLAFLIQALPTCLYPATWMSYYPRERPKHGSNMVESCLLRLFLMYQLVKSTSWQIHIYATTYDM